MLRFSARRPWFRNASSTTLPSIPAIARPRIALHNPWIVRRTIFGLPTPSNEPLAGTVDGSGPPYLFLLGVLVGFPTVLWAYKCLMMIVFQRSIIYLPSVPLGSRNEPLSPPGNELASQLNGLDWKEVTLETENKTRVFKQPITLKGIQLRLPPARPVPCSKKDPGEPTPVVIIYLQGNAGGPLGRVPLFRRLLSPREPSLDLTILAIAPRSYWLSTRTTPTESGILADYTSVLEHAFATHPNPATKFVLFGHSLGGAAAILLTRSPEIRSRISGVILENPLPSIPRMVQALYVEKWLPYRYLGIFVVDRWDSIRAIEVDEGLKGMRCLWIRSELDEIVPPGLVESMFDSCNSGEGQEWLLVRGALHDTSYTSGKWRIGIIKFLRQLP